MDRYGNIRHRVNDIKAKIKSRERIARALELLDEIESKQADKILARGVPLDPWEGEVEFTDAEIEAALAEWDERVPEAAGLLGG